MNDQKPEPKPATPDNPQASAELRSTDLLGFTFKPTWIKGHYHCRKCGGEMECWKQIRWNVKHGVSRLGGCVDCGQIFVEYENTSPKWLEVSL